MAEMTTTPSVKFINHDDLTTFHTNDLLDYLEYLAIARNGISDAIDNMWPHMAGTDAWNEHATLHHFLHVEKRYVRNLIRTRCIEIL